MYALTYPELVALGPCDLDKAAKYFGGAEAWGNRPVGIKEAREAGVSLKDMIWLASELAQTDAEAERRLRHWTCDVAERVLPVFEDEHPDDKRPREAIRVARLYAEGKATTKELAASWDAAWAALNNDEAAHAIAIPDAMWTATTAADAATWTATWAAVASGAPDAERQFQYDRLVYWFSETKPTLMETANV